MRIPGAIHLLLSYPRVHNLSVSSFPDERGDPAGVEQRPRNDRRLTGVPRPRADGAIDVADFASAIHTGHLILLRRRVDVRARPLGQLRAADTSTGVRQPDDQRTGRGRAGDACPSAVLRTRNYPPAFSARRTRPIRGTHKPRSVASAEGITAVD